MRIEIPIYRRAGGRLKYSEGSATLYDNTGNATWTYTGAKHRGIGIAACARSATVYMTRVLTALGYRIGHERMGEDGSVGYHLAVIKPANCLHQVRHPLKQIASMMTHRSWGWADQVLAVPDMDLLGCMHYWLVWNALCEEFCVWRYQIEDLPNVWDVFLDRIGHAPCELPSVPTDTNKCKKPVPELGWADLFNKDSKLASRIRDKSIQYGYATTGELSAAQVA